MSDRGFSRIIGVIGKAHGLDGYVFVRLVTDYPETIKKGHSLYLDEECNERLVIEDIKQIALKGENRVIFKFLSCNNIDDALLIRDKLLYRARKDSPILKDGSYWINDLIGCEVYLGQGKYIGRVEDVEKYAHNDNLFIKNNKKIMIAVPMTGDYIKSIDIKEKKITLKILPEYI